jgi:hypothetical protein
VHKVSGVSVRAALLLVAAACITALSVVGSAGAAPRACTDRDLEGTRAPAMLRDHGLDTQDGPLVAGTKYRVVVVQELAIGDNGQPVDGSIVVTAPSGPPLDQKTADRRPVYDFTPTKAGKVTLVVDWDEEVGSPGSGDICHASQSFDIPVLEPTKPTLVGRFNPGPRTLGSSFTLRLKGKKPQDPAKVSVVVRTRRGTTKPPAASGPALARFSFKPSGSGGFVGRAGSRKLSRTLQVDQEGAGVRIFPYPNIAFGSTLRFAFSIEVLQGGKRLGGMRSGATCRRIQFRQHSAVKCKPVGLQHRP